MRPAEPQRRCIGCRQVRPQRDLFRLVIQERLEVGRQDEVLGPALAEVVEDLGRVFSRGVVGVDEQEGQRVA